MLCVNQVQVVNPKTGVKISVPCGTCFACQINRRSSWMFRNSVELQYSKSAYFVTLTYDESSLKLLPHHGSTNLCMPIKRHYQLFLKRLRSFISPAKVRYFLCHEYGENTFRPHYHALLYFDVDLSLDSVRSLVSSCWRYGNITCDYVTPARCHYLTKYVCKQFRNIKNNDSTKRYIFDSDWNNKTLQGLYIIKYYMKKFSFIVASNGLGCQLLKEPSFINWFWSHLEPNKPYPTYTLNGRSFALPRIYLRKLVPDLWRNEVAPDNSVDARKLEFQDRAKELGLTVSEYKSNMEYLQNRRSKQIQQRYKVISKD